MRFLPLHLVLTGSIWTATSAPATNAPNPVDRFAEWIELEQEIEARRGDWSSEKAALEAEVRLLEAELKALDLAIAAARQSRDERRTEADAIATRNARTRDELATLEAALPDLQAALMELIPQLPPEIATTVRPAIQRSQRAEASLPDRMGDLTSALLRIAEAHQDIRVTSALHPFSDGEVREVEILYLGLSAAWFVDRTDRRAGFGSPGNPEWVWVERDSIAPAVRQAIKVVQKSTEPRILQLPLR